ncbi:MAG: hypothetical protein AVDCRST_MAG01-01-4062, partial [uncultured Rubrobacteraceae bacterium]
WSRSSPPARSTPPGSCRPSPRSRASPCPSWSPPLFAFTHGSGYSRRTGAARTSGNTPTRTPVN